MEPAKKTVQDAKRYLVQLPAVTDATNEIDRPFTPDPFSSGGNRGIDSEENNRLLWEVRIACKAKLGCLKFL